MHRQRVCIVSSCGMFSFRLMAINVDTSIDKPIHKQVLYIPTSAPHTRATRCLLPILMSTSTDLTWQYVGRHDTAVTVRD